MEPPAGKKDIWGGFAVFIVGLAILVPSGLCTAIFYGAFTTQGWDNRVLTIGAPFMLAGVALVGLGLFLAYKK